MGLADAVTPAGRDHADEAPPIECAPAGVRQHVAVGAASLAPPLALLAAAAAVAALALLRPDLPMAREPMSEYVHGPYSWVQIAVFFLVGLGSLSIAWQAKGQRRGRFGSERPFLFAWAVGMVLAGLIDVEDQVLNTDQGAVHNLVVKVAFVALLLAAVIERPDATGAGRRVRLALIVLLGVLMALTAFLDGKVGYGAAQRGLGAVALAWIIRYALRVNPGPDRHRFPSRRLDEPRTPDFPALPTHEPWATPRPLEDEHATRSHP